MLHSSLLQEIIICSLLNCSKKDGNHANFKLCSCTNPHLVHQYRVLFCSEKVGADLTSSSSTIGGIILFTNIGLVTFVLYSAPRRLEQNLLSSFFSCNSRYHLHQEARNTLKTVFVYNFVDQFFQSSSTSVVQRSFQRKHHTFADSSITAVASAGKASAIPWCAIALLPQFLELCLDH